MSAFKEGGCWTPSEFSPFSNASFTGDNFRDVSSGSDIGGSGSGAFTAVCLGSDGDVERGKVSGVWSREG